MSNISKSLTVVTCCECPFYRASHDDNNWCAENGMDLPTMPVYALSGPPGNCPLRAGAVLLLVAEGV